VLDEAARVEQHLTRRGRVVPRAGGVSRRLQHLGGAAECELVAPHAPH